ncbi:NUDIX domain-containing protein [Parabacteroides sp. OttesenSCG-928-B22]|nr:NUDIX domain-containing protein [Parabacteroides sp. OttesenSCG-928-B22]
MSHPLDLFAYCPKCGSEGFAVRNEKSKSCGSCGYIYYINPSAAVACFIRNRKGEYLIVRRGKEPAKGTLDLPGGFTDLNETAEEAARREVKEETNLDVSACRYLFSLPNDYLYSGLTVPTMDLFFECEVDTYETAAPNDDAAEILILRPEEIHPDDFGLTSIKKAVRRMFTSKERSD